MVNHSFVSHSILVQVGKIRIVHILSEIQKSANTFGKVEKISIWY